MKKSKYYLGLFVAVLTMFCFLKTNQPAFAADYLSLNAETAILVDADTGKILYQKNPDESLPPASMTKMLTEYIVLDAIKNGKITWDQKLPISEYAFKISQNRKLSNVPLRKDGQYSVRELFEAMGIYSANGAAIALSELVGGSESSFINIMNEKAKQFGMNNYKFVNVTGLNNRELMGMAPAIGGPDDENMFTARDSAILAYHLIKEHPEILAVSSVAKKTFREGTTDAVNMPNWNWMLPGLVFAYPGMDGLKTGSTTSAGYSFTGTAKRGNMRLISVVMKANSYNSRFSETRKLLDYGFANFVKQTILPAGFKGGAKATVAVVNGKEKHVGLVTNAPLTIVIKQGEQKLYEPVYHLNKKDLTPEGAITAPVAKGQELGVLNVNYKGQTQYGFLTANEQGNEKVPVVAENSVDKANWFVRLFRGIGSLFGKLFGLLKSLHK